MTRAMTSAEQAMADRLEAQLRREGLAAGEFDHDQARKAMPDKRDKYTPAEKAAYSAQAQAFLEEHAFKSRWEERCWELHAQGMSGRKISRTLKGGGRKQLSGAYRRKVDLTIARLKKLMLGRIARKNRGRPSEGGYGDKCTRIVVRLNAIDLGAIEHVQRMAEARRMPVPSAVDIVRVAIRAFARGA